MSAIDAGISSTHHKKWKYGLIHAPSSSKPRQRTLLLELLMFLGRNFQRCRSRWYTLYTTEGLGMKALDFIASLPWHYCPVHSLFHSFMTTGSSLEKVQRFVWLHFLPQCLLAVSGPVHQISYREKQHCLGQIHKRTVLLLWPLNLCKWQKKIACIPQSMCKEWNAHKLHCFS